MFFLVIGGVFILWILWCYVELWLGGGSGPYDHPTSYQPPKARTHPYSTQAEEKPFDHAKWFQAFRAMSARNFTLRIIRKPEEEK